MPYRSPATQMMMQFPEQMYAEWIWAHLLANRLTKKEFAVHARHLESMCPEAAEYLRFIILNGGLDCCRSNKATL